MGARATAVPAVVQIDHILGRGLTFSGAKVVRSGGSDHYPVRAFFDFKKEGDPDAGIPDATKR